MVCVSFGVGSTSSKNSSEWISVNREVVVERGSWLRGDAPQIAAELSPKKYRIVVRLLLFSTSPRRDISFLA